MSYIDKEKFRMHIIMYSYNPLKVKLTDKEKEKFIRMLDEVPTADVVERKYGKWIFSPDDAEGMCTSCNFKIYGRLYQNKYLIVPYNFCPNCGAKMDRSENE